MKKLWIRFLIFLNLLIICCAGVADILFNNATVMTIVLYACFIISVVFCGGHLLETLYYIIFKTCKDEKKKRNKEQTKPKEITAEVGFTGVDGDFIRTFKSSTSADALAYAKDFANKHNLKIISIKCY